MGKFLGLDRFKLDRSHTSSQPESRDNAVSGGIAVIGMACRFGRTNSPTEFWNILRDGEDCIIDMPIGRQQDLLPLIRKKGMDDENIRFRKAAYLEEIDKFDPAFFRLSPKEAGLMDPNQRLFLEACWEAIEDAGYGGDSLAGSRTGVFVGFSSDFGEEYKRMIKEIDPELLSLSAVGNIKSVIASRISYLLNLKGPSMLVDTACSSSLMAVHLACQSIRRRESDMALAGGVKVILMALDDGSNELGILSSDGRTRAFDHHSEGTGIGEGVGAILLKPLEQAIADGDPIYAVIKGSATNQDGASAGLTAPNSIAQQDVIVQAWKEARIDPNTLSYIEAHGTGTKLGDPIEIDGLERAFRHYTDRHQFCAIGSVKTNIGHTDHLAGIAGMIKVILSMKNKQLPPHLHFKSSNRNIRFESSPVYVNDTLADWKVDKGIRLSGISSFGLSGTNVHLVLEEAPSDVEDKLSSEDEMSSCYEGIFTLSGMTANSLKDLLKRYRSWFAAQSGHFSDVRNISYTANVGRSHYSYRLSIVYVGIEDLISKIDTACDSDLDTLTHSDIYYGWHKQASNRKPGGPGTEPTAASSTDFSRLAESLVQQLVRTSDSTIDGLRELARLYAQGADVRWKSLYSFKSNQRVHLPAYPFERKRCWPDLSAVRAAKPSSSGAEVLGYGEEYIHPLLQINVWEATDQSLFISNFSTDSWILSQHKLFGQFVVPGTTYIEMAMQAGQAYRRLPVTKLYDFVFLEPIILTENTSCRVQSMIRREGEHIHFKVISKREGEHHWREHAQAKLEFDRLLLPDPTIDFSNMQKEAHNVLHATDIYNGNIDQNYGPRFKNLKKVWVNGNTVLCHLKLADTEDLNHYCLHPGLLDSAVGSMVYCGLLGNELYLPFTYKEVSFYRALPSEIYCVCTRIDDPGVQGEIVKFNLSIMDRYGEVLAQIHEYSVKRVNELSAQRLLDLSDTSANIIWRLAWRREDKPYNEDPSFDVPIAVFRYEGDSCNRLDRDKNGRRLNVFDNIMNGQQDQAEFNAMVSELRAKSIETVIYMAPAEWHNDTPDEEVITDLFRLFRALVSEKLHERLTLCIVTEGAYQVTVEDAVVVPRNRGLLSLGSVINQEHQTLHCICIDVDGQVDILRMIRQESALNTQSPVAYRSGNRYVMELDRSIVTPETNELSIQANGVYVITGGLGGIGLEIASCLADLNSKVTIALISRTTLPHRDLWDDITASSDDNKLTSRIQKIRDLEATGATIISFTVDVADSSAIESLFVGLRERFGRINGIVHGAGIAGDGFLFRKEESGFTDVLLPKVRGAIVLDSHTESDELDFFIVFSSITGWLGGVGQGDYAAASAYLDAFAQARTMRGKPTLAIAWSAWKETGMAVDYNAVTENSIFKPLSTAIALQAFRRLLMASNGQVTVGELNYDRISTVKNEHPIMLANAVQIEVDKRVYESDRQGFGSGTQLKCVRLLGKQEEEISPTERKLADIWGDILGIEELNVYDNFYDLGGDSIIAVKLSSHIAHYMNREVDVTDIFNYLTIAELARFLVPAGETETDKQEIEEQGQPQVPSINRTSGADAARGQQQGEYNYANQLSWRQFNCYDRGLALMMTADESLIQHFKLLLGMKRGFDLQDEGYPFDYYSQEEVSGYPSDNELLQQFGYCVRTEKVDDMQQLHRMITRQLDNKMPVMVSFDEYYTFYTPFYMKEHTDHLTILTEYDADKKLYMIINHNHLARTSHQKVSYGQFMTTYQTIEEIYAFLPEESRCILTLERVPDSEAPLQFDYAQQLNRLLLALQDKQQVGREFENIYALVERPELEESELKEALNEIYVNLGGKELWVQTLLDWYVPSDNQELRQLGDKIITISSRLVNNFVLSIYRKKRMKPSDITVAIEELQPIMAVFIQKMIDYTTTHDTDMNVIGGGKDVDRTTPMERTSIK
ncbi:hypothetical protein A3844_28615 [Paenibacillus helianthi]|uniref:Carrier domain-containing protein n=1 Tax=Paenibacillus helianthi TaxID=1349432 RepID=A0ABX3EHC7_9BACL|nr:beta-ketoacyl synthase N-terminal-like domain-containing protein [Paenibacillus helianthi]OKP79493.1 hypothetical protein A3844_28615 [Paenibacillus helianthi]